MVTADSVLWIIPYTVESPCGLRSTSVCWGHPNSDSAGYLRRVAITSGAEISRQSRQASLMQFAGPIWDNNKWSDSDKHSQLTADI